MKIKANLLLGQNLGDCKMINLVFIEDKVIGIASFTNIGCLINIYDDLKHNLYKMLSNGLYDIIGNIVDLNQFGECAIVNNKLLDSAINYIKTKNINCNEISKSIIDRLDKYETEGKNYNGIIYKI